MKLRLVPTIGIVLGSLTLGGCEQPGGVTIPPTKGGDEARASIESPFGPATNVKPRKTTKTPVPDR